MKKILLIGVIIALSACSESNTLQQEAKSKQEQNIKDLEELKKGTGDGKRF